MTDRIYVGAYWGVRQETAEACTARVVGTLHELDCVDSQFCRWFTLGRSRKEALRHQVTISQDKLCALLKKGVNRGDFDKQPIPDLGFSIGLWNGAPDDESVGLSIHCGMYSPWVNNSVVLDLPSDGKPLGRLLNFAVIRRIALIVVKNWAPDWLTVNTDHLRDDVLKLPVDVPDIGWLTYLSPAYGRPSGLLSTMVERTDGGGTLLIATREPFSSDNPNHVAGARTIANAVTSLVKKT
jgi:hypothetical protein